MNEQRTARSLAAELVATADRLAAMHGLPPRGPNPGDADLYSPEVEALSEDMTCHEEGHVPGCAGGAGGDHELAETESEARLAHGDR
jgi:hypothetical protein